MGLTAGLAAGGALLGGKGAKKQAKASNKPTSSYRTPASQLGGWDRIQQALDQFQNAYDPSNRYQMGNPYLSSILGDVFKQATGGDPGALPPGGPPPGGPPPGGPPPGGGMMMPKNLMEACSGGFGPMRPMRER